MKNWKISRRRMLKGVGACIALPFLDAMALPGMSSPAPAPSPIRTTFFFMPNGVHPDRWTPLKTGYDWELTQQLRPLANLKGDVQILGELMNHNSVFKGADGHYTKSASMLTCMPIRKTVGDNINSGGVSVDQVIASHVGNDTMFPSLEYGLDRITTGVDINVGYTRVYGSSISWQSATRPNSKEIDPRLAFDRLFRSYLPGAKPKEDVWKKSILDQVAEDANGLKRNLGRSDQDKLSEYLESIYSVEKRITSEEQRQKFASHITKDIQRELVRLNMDINTYMELREGVDITEKTRLMLDIIALSMWSDASRVSTFMFGNSVSDRNFTFLNGVNGSHHSISHHMNKPSTMEEYALIAEWHVAQYSYFIEKLKSIREGEKTLLDNSMVMFMSDLRDGNRHEPHNLPIILAGKGGGILKPGKNIVFPKDTPLANLYLTMLQSLGVQQHGFGDSTGVLSDILA